QPVEQALGGEVDPLGCHRRWERRAGRRPEAGGESQPMVVLGIDPGLASTGYGVGESRPGARAGRGRGRGRTRAAGPQERRLADIPAAVVALLRDHRPDAVALEELYFGANVRTAFAVGHARGVAVLAAGQRGLPCASYTPQQVKAAVCGNGRAGKDQV